MTTQVKKLPPDSAYEPLLQNDSDLGAPIEAQRLVASRRGHHQSLPRNTIHAFCAVVFILIVSNLVFLGELIRLRNP